MNRHCNVAEASRENRVGGRGENRVGGSARGVSAIGGETERRAGGNRVGGSAGRRSGETERRVGVREASSTSSGAPVRYRCVVKTPTRRPILIATKYLVFRGQDTSGRVELFEIASDSGKAFNKI